MFLSAKRILHALVSDKALSALYDERKALRPSQENRTPLSLVVTGTLFGSVLVYLMSQAWLRQDLGNYLASKTAIIYLNDVAEGWRVTTPMPKDCLTPQNCLASVRAIADENASTLNLSDYRILTNADSARTAPEQLIYLSRNLDVSTWRTFERLNDPLIFGFPKIEYQRADAFVDGQYVGAFYASDRLALVLDQKMYAKPSMQLEVVFTVSAYQNDFLIGDRTGKNALLSHFTLLPRSEDIAYREYVIVDQQSRGDVIGFVARLVMAVFVLALFMIIDGSPETLGLSLFLGFEGFAMTFREGIIPVANPTFLTHFCFQMGDIFRLFFFLQMARMVDKNVKPWLLWGAVLSVPYGLLRHFGTDASFYWVDYIPRSRDLVVGALGVLVCTRSAYFLRDKKLPWRVIALAVAAIASLEQTLEPLGYYVPQLALIPGFDSTLDIMQGLSAWLLAFSAFINISTLENRVKTLTDVATQAKIMEAEMELAQSVQQAFFKVPQLPPDLTVVCFHEAMLYVSGDTYFVDWNEKHQKLSFLITDVTGHGVQAALKASSVSVIATTVWHHEPQAEWTSGKITRYVSMVKDFFERMAAVPDIVAVGGGEFDLKTGNISLYRQNFPFPFVITPKQHAKEAKESRWDDTWVIAMLPLANETEVKMNLAPGTFIIFSSDGFLDNSRVSHEFMKYLRKHIARESNNLTAEQVRKVILDCKIFQGNHTADDRTLTIFQWNQNAETVKNVTPLRVA